MACTICHVKNTEYLSYKWKYSRPRRIGLRKFYDERWVTPVTKLYTELGLRIYLYGKSCHQGLDIANFSLIANFEVTEKINFTKMSSLQDNNSVRNLDIACFAANKTFFDNFIGCLLTVSILVQTIHETSSGKKYNLGYRRSKFIYIRFTCGGNRC